MDIYLNKEKINYIKNVFSTSLAHEETMEMIVPDALPDILRILDTDATVFLRSKATDNGRVTVTGIAATTVLYCPENENSIRKMTLEIPFSVMATDPEITPNSRITATVRMASADSAMVNPRKIVARVNFLTDVACFNDTDVLIASGLDENNEAGIELMTASDNIDMVTTVKEKTFTITDELTIPSVNPSVGEILKCRVLLIPEDTKIVGSKLILKGTVNTSLLYNAANSNEPTKTDFDTEFSQIIELDGAPGDSNFNITMMMTNAYFDAEPNTHNPDGRIVVMEIHAVAQCVSQEKKQISFISDLYSTKYKLEQTIEDHVFETKSKTNSSAVFHGLLETPLRVARVIAANVNTGPVTNKPQSNTMVLQCPLNVSVLYQADDNSLMSVSHQFDVESNIDAVPNAAFTAKANCGKDIFCAASGNGIELRIPVELTMTQSNELSMKTLSNLSYDETAPIDYTKAPSLTLCRTTLGDTLWKLAKKHMSTAPLILSANGIEREENISPGQLLIIPQKR